MGLKKIEKQTVVELANRHKLKINFAVDFDIVFDQLPQTIYHMNAIVLQEASELLVIGMNFLVRNRAALDFEEITPRIDNRFLDIKRKEGIREPLDQEIV